MRRAEPASVPLGPEPPARPPPTGQYSTESRTLPHARKADWLKMVTGQHMTGVQLFLGSVSHFQKAYKADGIPHFILLDPEGKIVNSNMLRPSSPDIRAYLDRQPGL